MLAGAGKVERATRAIGSSKRLQARANYASNVARLHGGRGGQDKQWVQIDWMIGEPLSP